AAALPHTAQGPSELCRRPVIDAAVTQVTNGRRAFAIEERRQSTDDPGRKSRALVDHAGIEPDQIGAGADLFQRILRGAHAADADDREFRPDASAHPRQYSSGALKQRRSGHAPRFTSMDPVGETL